jgi:hypothetical protein
MLLRVINLGKMKCLAEEAKLQLHCELMRSSAFQVSSHDVASTT